MAPVVALTGFMGSGKSTIGLAVASRLAWRFADLDDEIERRSGRSIPEWFREEGETAFRAIEARTLGELLRDAVVQEGGGLVLALGGGAVTAPSSAALVRESAFVVYLAVSPRVAWQRVRRSARPLATDEEAFVALACTRESAYLSSADAVVECGSRCASDLAAEVVGLLAGRGLAA